MKSCKLSLMLILLFTVPISVNANTAVHSAAIASGHFAKTNIPKMMPFGV